MVKNLPAMQVPGLGRSWRKEWQPTPVFLPGVNTELPNDPASPLPGLDPKELKTENLTGTSTLKFIAALKDGNNPNINR